MMNGSAAYRSDIGRKVNYLIRGIVL